MNRCHPSAAECLLWLGLVVPCACSSTSSAAHKPHHHRVTTTVSVDDAGVRPQPAIKIPLQSTVVWRNQGTRALRIAVDTVSCGSCETVLGFRGDADGAQAVSIAPGSVATLCFHQPGKFAFVAEFAGVTHRGVIDVADQP